MMFLRFICYYLNNFLFFVLFYMLFLFCSCLVYGQCAIRAKITFIYDKEIVKETKRFLRRYEIFILVDGEEVGVKLIGDSVLCLMDTSFEKITYIRDKEFLVMIFRRGKECFCQEFPNAFFVYGRLSGLQIFRLHVIWRNLAWRSKKIIVVYDAGRRTYYHEMKRCSDCLQVGGGR